MAQDNYIAPTTLPAQALPGSRMVAKGRVQYYFGNSGPYFAGKAGFVYSTAPITVAVAGTINGYTYESVSSAAAISRVEYPKYYDYNFLPPTGGIILDEAYQLNIFNLAAGQTYYIRSYVQNDLIYDANTETGLVEYGAQVTISTLPSGLAKGYYISESTVGFFNPLQIRNSGEAQDSILVADSSGLATWKPVKQLFSSGHYVGELYGGGVVAAVWREGDDEKVLIVSTEDVLTYTSPVFQQTTPSWSTGAAQTALAGANNKYSGYLNTTKILAQAGSLGTTYSAARGAADYKGGGYEDWYLPSYFEMNQVFNNAAIINKVLGRESFITANSNLAAYWTSTESPLTTWPPSEWAIICAASGYQAWKKDNISRVRPVRIESYNTGDGLILALDATNKKSISDLEYLRTGTASKWRCLVNAGLTNSYHFALSSWPASSSDTFVSTMLAGLSDAGASENIGKRKSGNFTLTAVNGTTSPALYNNGASSSIVSDYFTPFGTFPYLSIDITDASTTPNPTKAAVDISVSVVENGITSEYDIIRQVTNTSGSNNVGLKIPLVRYIGKSISVKIEAPNATYVSSTNKSGPGIDNIILLSESGKHVATGPIYNSSESGFFRFNGTGSNASDSSNSFGGYVEFVAPVGNTSIVTVELWCRLGVNYIAKAMFGWDIYGIFAASNGSIGFNTGNGDIYGISAARVQQLGLVGNWKHYVFVMNRSVSYTFNKMYINGEEQVLAAQVAPYGGSLGVEDPANRNFSNNTVPGRGRIGGYSTRGYGQNMYLFNGDIAAFRIYSRSLNKDEVMKNFSKEKKRYQILPSILRDGLATHIDFNIPASYSQDGSANGTISDISGSGINAALTIGTLSPVINRTGSLYEGRSLFFAGTSAANPTVKWTNTAAPNTALNSITQRVSVSLWIKLDSIASGLIAAKSITDTNNSSWEIYVVSGKIFFRIRSASAAVPIESTSAISASRWTNICATFESSTGRVRIYINSSLDREYFVQPGFTLQSDTGGMYLGKYPNGASPMSGSIESFQLYNREISVEEVKNNYDAVKFAFERSYADSNQFYAHEINGSPTFSISQNLTLDLGGTYNEKVLKLGTDGTSKWVDKSNVFSRPTNQRIVGDLYGGGIIVATWAYPKSVFNYLIMSTQDIAQNVAWSNITAAVSGASSDFRGDTNTNTIIAQSGHSTSAAKLCKDYNGGGYTDWYLPSVFEMNQAFNAAGIIGTITGTDSISGRYWTSTEPVGAQAALNAYIYSVSAEDPINNNSIVFGFQKLLEKTLTANVRAFRFATTAVTTTPWRPWWREEYPIWIEWEQNWNPRNYWEDYNWEFNYFSFTNVSTGQITYTPAGSTMFGPYPPSNFNCINSSVSTSENVIEFGVCYLFTYPYPYNNNSILNAIPTTSDSKVVGSGAYSQFTVNIPLTFGSPVSGYYTFLLRTRAYAITNSGTYYGPVVVAGDQGN
jgi:hypothetical protein